MVGMGDWTVLGGWGLGLDSPWPEAPSLDLGLDNPAIIAVWDWIVPGGWVLGLCSPWRLGLGIGQSFWRSGLDCSP